MYIIIILNQVAKIQDTRSAIFFEKICFNFYLFSHATTIVPWNTLETKAASTSWLEQELDGNEAFITETERVLSKNREDITLADLETIQELDI
ncbi:TPA: hypothetical protein U0369_002656, partial [Listeria monocytogenes]|nr:hypothetical protein [Listeria monocytogenes]